MEIERLYDSMLVSCRRLTNELKKQRKYLEYLDTNESQRKLIDSINRTKNLCVKIYNNLASDELYSELTLNRLSDNPYTDSYVEEYEGIVDASYFEGNIVIKIPLLPSSSGARVRSDYSIENTQFVNRFYVKSVSDRMCKLLEGLGDEKDNICSSMRNKALLIVHNYGLDYTGKAIADATNHYTAKLQNAVLDWLPNGDGGRTCVVHINEFIKEIPTATYLIISPLEGSGINLEWRSILVNEWGNNVGKAQ